MVYPMALLIPLFLLLIYLEWRHDQKKGQSNFNFANLANNMTVGAIDQFASFGYLFLMYGVLNWVHGFKIITWEKDWLHWVIAFLAVDFTSYWYHRASHKVNLLWAAHVTHHSSEFFNFSNGFRTSPFQGLFRVVFWLWMPLMGFDPFVLVLCFQISGLHDFLVHTSHIKNLGWLEKIIVTPSHHRVHHGKNDIYIDKNFSSFFIIWDKLFGTFQSEEEKVEYGVKSEFKESNPIFTIFSHFHYLFTTTAELKGIKNKLRLWFNPPSWSPPEYKFIQNNEILEK